MFLCILALLSLDNSMREADPEVLNPWYANDAPMRGPARHNTKLLCALIENGPYHGYLFEPEKIWYICADRKEEEGKRSLLDSGYSSVRLITSL